MKRLFVLVSLLLACVVPLSGCSAGDGEEITIPTLTVPEGWQTGVDTTFTGFDSQYVLFAASHHVSGELSDVTVHRYPRCGRDPRKIRDSNLEVASSGLTREPLPDRTIDGVIAYGFRDYRADDYPRHSYFLVRDDYLFLVEFEGGLSGRPDPSPDTLAFLDETRWTNERDYPSFHYTHCPAP